MGEEKYRLVRNYAQIFATAMKDKWQCRVYIDLFAGAGRARIKDSGKIVDGSQLIALGIENPFDRYIFCEQNPNNMNALSSRVKDEYPERDIHFVPGDANQTVDQILSLIPRPSSSYNRYSETAFGPVHGFSCVDSNGYGCAAECGYLLSKSQ